MRSLCLLAVLALAGACEEGGDDDGSPSEPDASMAEDAGLDARAADARAPDADLHDAAMRDANIDAGHDASTLDDAGYLGCYEANNLVRSRLYGQDAGLWLFKGSCVSDQDCVRAPSEEFACSGRNIRFQGCGTVIARALESDYTRWVDQLEAELCPSIRAPCSAIDDCGFGTPRCVQSRCEYSAADAGSP